MLGGETTFRLDGEVDGAAPQLLIILLAGMGVVLHLLERLEGLEDRLLLRRLLLHVWPVIGLVEGLVVLRFRYRCRRFLLPSLQIRGPRLLLKLQLQLLPSPLVLHPLRPQPLLQRLHMPTQSQFILAPTIFPHLLMLRVRFP
jgi:hypothetical protein